MKYKLTLYYSVSNGGDGSAYPQFCESMELAEFHQDLQNEFKEGFGESCTGQIVLNSESPISTEHSFDITKESLKEELDYYLAGGYKKSESIKKKAQEFLERFNKILDALYKTRKKKRIRSYYR